MIEISDARNYLPGAYPDGTCIPETGNILREISRREQFRVCYSRRRYSHLLVTKTT